MGVITDITLVPKNNSLINSAKVSELILDALEALNCLTDIKHHHEHFDRKIGMRFINDVMIGRIPLFYPYKEGDVVAEGTQTKKYVKRTPSIYYPLGFVDKEAYESCVEPLKNMQDYVSIHVDSDESGCELMMNLGREILKKSDEYLVYYRPEDGNYNYILLNP